MDKLGITLVICGFVGMYLSAAASDCGNDITLCILPAIASLGVMLIGALILWVQERRYGNDE